jgi:hypothetical protein
MFEISSPVKTDLTGAEPAGIRGVLLENITTLLMNNLLRSITFLRAQN